MRAEEALNAPLGGVKRRRHWRREEGADETEARGSAARGKLYLAVDCSVLSLAGCRVSAAGALAGPHVTRLPDAARRLY